MSSSLTTYLKVHKLQVFFISIVGSVLCVMCYTYLLQGQSEIDLRQLVYFTGYSLSSRKQLNTSDNDKLVLLWTPFFSQQDWIPTTTELNCSVKSCRITYDHSYQDQSSAIVMHWRDVDIDDLPKPDNNAVVVLFNMEAPPHTQAAKMSYLQGKVHWTAMYRRDSDIHTPYGRVLNRVGEYTPPNLESNRSLVCWLVSNCHTPSNRESYVKELQKYVPVEVYGACGNHKCSFRRSQDCYKWLSTKCQFYLSFENSICRDYVTEKLFYVMQYDMVPVVLGGDDYAANLPSHSFINAKDFKTPRALADFLIKLSANKTKYLEYFKWKQKLEVSTLVPLWFCDLCAKLHESDPSKIKPRTDLLKWWFDGAHCSKYEL